MDEPVFLTLVEVIEINKNQIDLYGGDKGIRDMGLLQSAIAQPQASFAGEWLHDDLYLMASAYIFHICKNHLFIDGNKRTALAAGLVFLELNGIEIHDPRQMLYKAMMDLANGKSGKYGMARILKDIS